MRILACTLLTVAAASALVADATAHGGAPYRGPGECVPPQPQEPLPPARPSPDPDRVPLAGHLLSTGSPGPDLSIWVFWWEFNKDRYLNLRAKVHASHIIACGGCALTGLGAAAQPVNTLAPTRAQLEEAVEALHGLAEQCADADIASATMMALARIGRQPERARKLYARHLDASERWVRETAVLAFGVLRDPAADPLLRELIRDSATGRTLVGSDAVDTRTRAIAAYAVALLAERSPDADFRRSVAQFLDATLANTSGYQTVELRVACLLGLSLAAPPEPAALAEALMNRFDRGELESRVAAHLPVTLARLLATVDADAPQHPRAVALLLTWLAPNSTAPPWLRQSAAQALGRLAGRCDLAHQRLAFDALCLAQSQARDMQTKNFTAIALADLAADSRDSALRREIIDFLVAKMAKSSTAYEPWAGLALGVLAWQVADSYSMDFPHAAVVATQEKFRSTRTPRSKAAYALALGLMSDDAIKVELRTSWEEVQDEEYRDYVGIALGLLGAGEYRDDLLLRLDAFPDGTELLLPTATALGLMKARQVVDRLLEHLAPRDGKRPRLAVLAAVTVALGTVGDRNAVAALIETLQDENLTPLGRAFAALGLGLLGDQDLLPWTHRVAADLNYRAELGLLLDFEQGTGILDLR